MANPLREYIMRAAGPRIVMRAWDEKRRLGRFAAGVQRLAGGRCEIEIYLAFDDPYSAVALPPLLEMCGRRRCRLTLYPLARHGIENDPDAELRRAYAVKDGARLARRQGRTLTRARPIEPEGAAFLAAWAEAARDAGKIEPFCQAALAAIWSGNPPADLTPEALDPVYQAAVGGPPPPAGLSRFEVRVRENEKRFAQQRLWETPMARVAGEPFFAHERLRQIEERLGELGW